MTVGCVLPMKDTKEPHGKNEVSPHHPQQAGHVVHEETAGAAGDARAAGIDSNLL